MAAATDWMLIWFSGQRADLGIGLLTYTYDD